MDAGIDGIVMPDLRGVSVWLTATNTEIRRLIIESDPVGIAFQGDAERFGREDTGLLISGLEAQLKHQQMTQQWERASSASLGALMAGPGREILSDMLRAPDRSEVRHYLVERLLRGLGEATLRDARSGVSGSEEARRDAYAVLAATVQDPSWRSSVRNRALNELIWVFEDLAEGPSILLGLLHGFAEGEVPEDERGTLGLRLLDYLYPQHLGAERFWAYVEQLWTAPPPSVRSWNGDKTGWARRLVNRLAPGDVRILLETLVRNSQRLNEVLAQNGAEYFAERLLTRSLQLFGEETEPAHLYEWFELVQAANDQPGLVLAHCEGVTRKTHDDPWIVAASIYGWLRSHRDIQFALVLEGLKRNASHPRDRALDHAIGVKFLGDKAPPGFRRWCLGKAVTLAKTDPASAVELAFWSVTEREIWGPPLNEEEVLTALRETPLLLEWQQRAAEAAQDCDSRQSHQGRDRREAYVSSIRERLPVVEAGHGPPEILHELGRVYLGGLETGGANQARTALGRHLGDENDIRDGVIRGFRNLVERTDLPTQDEIVGLHEGGRLSPFGAPFLAGLTEEECAGAEPFEHRDEEALRRTLAFYLLSGLHTRPHRIPVSFGQPETFALRRPKQPRPRWYLHVLKSHPQIVADVFVAVNRARVRRRSGLTNTCTICRGSPNTVVWGRWLYRRCSGRFPVAAPRPRSSRFAWSCGPPSSTCSLTIYDNWSCEGCTARGWILPSAGLGLGPVFSSTVKRAFRGPWSSCPMALRQDAGIYSNSSFRTGTPCPISNGPLPTWSASSTLWEQCCPLHRTLGVSSSTGSFIPCWAYGWARWRTAWTRKPSQRLSASRRNRLSKIGAVCCFAPATSRR